VLTGRRDEASINNTRNAREWARNEKKKGQTRPQAIRELHKKEAQFEEVSHGVARNKKLKVG